MTKDKVQGMFLGAYLGDCLGKVCESWTPEKIKETYGRITTLLEPTEHSWFEGEEIGKATDDWQLTKATAEALIDSGGFSMTKQAKYHVKAMKESTSGWGRSTKESVMRLDAGISWKKSGQKMGCGNGIVMKLGPIAAISSTNRYNLAKCEKFIIDFAQMTHKTSLVTSSSFVHMLAVRNCLLSNELNTEHFIKNIYHNALSAEQTYKRYRGDTITDKLSDRLVELSNHKEYDTDRIIKDFGAGSCYVYNSLPFTYMFFIKNPHSIESLFDVVNAGGDTDTNGSILASMLGALNGVEVFPQALIESIPKEYYEEVMDLANRFADKFKFE
jgi:ADP-ribosyl-[dinitrogen reductase] hydrolase